MRLGLIMTWFTESFCSVKIDFDYLRDGPKLIGLHGGSDYVYFWRKKLRRTDFDEKKMMGQNFFQEKK